MSWPLNAWAQLLALCRSRDMNLIRFCGTRLLARLSVPPRVASVTGQCCGWPHFYKPNLVRLSLTPRSRTPWGQRERFGLCICPLHLFRSARPQAPGNPDVNTMTNVQHGISQCCRSLCTITGFFIVLKVCYNIRPKWVHTECLHNNLTRLWGSLNRTFVSVGAGRISRLGLGVDKIHYTNY